MKRERSLVDDLPQAYVAPGDLDFARHEGLSSALEGRSDDNYHEELGNASNHASNHKKRSRRNNQLYAPEKFDGVHWEQSRDLVGLELIGDISADEWEYIVKDESRRSFVAYLPASFLMLEEFNSFYNAALSGTNWEVPCGSSGPIPASMSWMVKDGCKCKFCFGGGLKLEPQRFPEWMLDIMGSIMPLCGLHDEKEWPDSCCLTLFEDATKSVGWHAHDTRPFQAVSRDARFITLSLGSERKYEFRLNHCEDGEEKLHRLNMGNGDLMVMEGMLQKHFQTRVPKQQPPKGPHISLSWRWITKHLPRCKHASR